MSESPNVDVSTIHTIWNFVLTGAIGVAGWFMKRTIDKIDEKADKVEVEKDIRQLREDFNRLVDRGDQQHRDNVSRLDNILIAVTTKGD